MCCLLLTFTVVHTHSVRGIHGNASIIMNLKIRLKLKLNYSVTGFVCKGMSYITAKGQKAAGNPAIVSQLLDTIGHSWAYQHIERRMPHSFVIKSYQEYGLKNNEHHLRKYFETGGEAFGTHIIALIHNLTTPSYLSSCYEGRKFNQYYSLTFHSEILQKITLNMYPQIRKKINATTTIRGF